MSKRTGPSAFQPIARALVVLPLLAAAAVYAGTLRHGFVWDDNVIVERQLASMRDLRSIFFPPAHLEFSSTYYRPLIFASYRFDEWLGGGAPWAFHLTPVIAHMTVSCLVYAFGAAIGLAATEALGGAILFAVHPIHVESVAWMAGRSDVLASLFLLSGALALWKTRGFGGFVAGTLLLFAATLSKESAVLSAILIPLGASLCGASNRRAWLAVALAAVLYAALRLLAGASRPVDPTQSLELAQLGSFLGLYASKLVLPLQLDPLIVDAQPRLLFVALSILAVAMAWALYRSNRRDRRVQFLILWIGLSLLPAVIPVLWRAAAAPFAERYLYIPSIGFCLLVARLVGTMLRPRPSYVIPSIALSLLLLTAIGVTAAERSEVWHDSVSLWTQIASEHPNDWMPQFELAKALADSGELARAERLYGGALEMAHGSDAARVLNNLGSLYNSTGRDEMAEAAWRQSLTLEPEYVDPTYNLGVLLWQRGKAHWDRGDSAGASAQLTQARGYLETALRLDPQLYQGHYALGSLAVMIGDFALAREHLSATIRLAPYSREAEYARLVANQIPPASP